MNLGIGAYAPSLILFGFLGMDLKAVFPVMMGSCAFIMPTSGIRFIGRGSYSPRAALGLALGGGAGRPAGGLCGARAEGRSAALAGHREWRPTVLWPCCIPRPRIDAWLSRLVHETGSV
jgi:hypothetical protein